MNNEPGTRIHFKGDANLGKEAVSTVMPHATSIRDKQKQSLTIGRFKRTINAVDADYECTFNGNQTNIIITAPSEVLKKEKERQKKKLESMTVPIFILLRVEKDATRKWTFIRDNYFLDYAHTHVVLAGGKWNPLTQELEASAARKLTALEFRALWRSIDPADPYSTGYTGPEYLIGIDRHEASRQLYFASLLPELGLQGQHLLSPRDIVRYTTNGHPSMYASKSDMFRLVLPIHAVSGESYFQPVGGCSLWDLANDYGIGAGNGLGEGLYRSWFGNQPVDERVGGGYGHAYGYPGELPCGFVEEYDDSGTLKIRYYAGGVNTFNINTCSVLSVTDTLDTCNTSTDLHVRRYFDDYYVGKCPQALNYFSGTAWNLDAENLSYLGTYNFAISAWSSNFGWMMNGIMLSTSYYVAGMPRRIAVTAGPSMSDNVPDTHGQLGIPAWEHAGIGYDVAVMSANVLWGYSTRPGITDVHTCYSIINVRGYCQQKELAKWSDHVSSDVFTAAIRTITRKGLIAGGAAYEGISDLPEAIFTGGYSGIDGDFRNDTGLCIANRGIRSFQIWTSILGQVVEEEYDGTI